MAQKGHTRLLTAWDGMVWKSDPAASKLHSWNAICAVTAGFRVHRGRFQHFVTQGEICGMAYKETFWMACDSTEQLRAEYGPFHTRAEAEAEAKKLGFGYLLRYEHLLGENEEIQEVRCIFVELPGAVPVGHEHEGLTVTLHTRCATCGESAAHEKGWQAEVWADIHEFEHSRHRVRLFEHARGKGLKEIGDWRG